MIEDLARAIRDAGFRAEVVRKGKLDVLRTDGLPPAFELRDGKVLFQGIEIDVELAKPPAKKAEGPRNLAQRAAWFSKRSGA